MTSLGNKMANHMWEANMEKGTKPQPDDSRQRKEQFFKAKYIDKTFLEPIPEGTSISDYLVKAVLESDMRSLCLALAHSTSSDVNSDNNQQRKSPLHVAITQSNLAITQLFLWFNADVDEMDKENRTLVDIARQLSGGSSQDICDLLMSSHANSSSPSAKVFHESKLL
jgi:ankyrin repeat protein